MNHLQCGAYISSAEAAALRGYAPTTLRNKRYLGLEEVPFTKLGSGQIVYLLSDVEEYVRIHGRYEGEAA